MRTVYKIGILLLLSAAPFWAQQQGLFTNILLHQYLYNPAVIAAVNGQQYNLGYRQQWMGFEGAPSTAVLSGYGNVRKKPNMAVGATVLSERIGLLDYTSFYGIYSYHLQLNKKAAINFGLGLGGVQYSVKAYDARAYDKDDSYLSSGVLNAFAFDANAGLYFYTKNFFFGFSDQHMPNARILWENSIGRLISCFYTYTGYNIRLGEKKEWVIQPSVLMRKSSPTPYQLELNLRTTYKELIWVGFNYRVESTCSALIGCTIDKQFSCAYGYDFSLTDMSKYSTGSHEIILSYFLPLKKKRSKSEQQGDADEEELNTVDNSIKTSIKKKKDNEDPKQDELKNKEEKKDPEK